MKSTNWSVLRIKQKHEFKAANELEKMGFDVYCPFVVELRQWSDRKKKIKTLLFPGKLFIRVNNSTYNQVFLCPRVQGYLFVQKKLAQVRNWELNAVRNYCNHIYSTHLQTVSVGQIIDVPLFQHKGEVIEVRGDMCTVILSDGLIKTRFRLVS